MVNVPAFTTYCGLGAERIGPITAISRSCANPFASDPRSFVGAAISVILHIITNSNCAGLNQAEESGAADSEWGVDECGRMHVGHQEIADGADFPCLITNRSALDPESGSSYDDSEFSDDDDAEYLVTSAKRRFSRIYQTMRSYHLRTPHSEKYTRRCKEMKKNCEKGTIIARHSGDVMVLAGCKILSMISTFHDNSTYTGTSAGEECEKPICVKDCNTTMGALI
ncbi:hypothetical protein EVAR_90833_1 [Eumeta japonica]|uniref:Uncharacterized protein n=1 Tax=Eumeta variegata TaxID=151549 RepID=A0A4C1ZVE4_EUMVA|nr:hypothetical protein EVAR_90833_1 [Eumeta japonica]